MRDQAKISGHAIAATLLALAGSPAQAAPFLYRVEPPTVDALLSHELESSETNRGGFGSQTDTRTTIEELDIRTNGWLYHPAMLTFSAGFQPEFQQQHVEHSQGNAQDTLGTFLGFGLDASVLPYKPYTLDLHASQSRDKYKSTLARDQISESSVYRAKLRLKEYWMPTAFTLESRDLTTESFYTMRDRTELARLESQHRSENSDTRLDAEFQDRTRGMVGYETASQQLVLQARNRYRPSDTSDTFSDFRHTRDRWLGVERTQTSLDSSLSVRHREKLRSDYRINLEDRRDDGYDSRSGSANASLQHTLYENLTTILSGDVNKSESTSGDIDGYGAAADFTYTRRIPWGRVNANVGRSARIQDWRQLLADKRVNGEAHTITFDQPWVELAQPDIDLASIEVWSPDRSVRYTEGIDYSVGTIGRNVILSWLPVLVPAEVVAIVVDYSYATDPSAKTRLTSDVFGVGVNLWSMLGLRYDWNRTRMDLLSGAHSTRDTQDRDSRLLSATLNLGWSTVKSTTRASMGRAEFVAEEWVGGRGAATQDRWGLSQLFRIGNWSATTLELEDVKMSGDRAATSLPPARTERARQLFTYRPIREMTLSAGANYSGVHYKDTGDRTVSRGYEASMRWLVDQGLFSARAFTRDTWSRLFGTESLGVEADYQWHWGPWHPSVRGSRAEEKQLPREATPGSESIRTILYFEIKREFR